MSKAEVRKLRSAAEACEQKAVEFEQQGTVVVLADLDLNDY